MSIAKNRYFIAGPEDTVLITGAGGFIGSRVVERLLELSQCKVRCFVRSTMARGGWLSEAGEPGKRVQVVRGNLLSRQDCRAAVQGVSVVLHLAAGRGEKSYPDAFMNSVVTTRNLLDACVEQRSVRRFVNVSSFAVYANDEHRGGHVLDETCRVEEHPERRGEAYCYAKVRQDEIVEAYGREHAIPYVIVRPGVVYGPGNLAITGRVGITTFGPFLHMGGSNRIPFTYVDNCAEAIVLAGLAPDADGRIFNVLDDNLPTSRQFLRMYKRQVRRFRSYYVPKPVSFLFCWLWERYCERSHNQIPPAFNRGRWRANWRPTRYSNEKLKTVLGWNQPVSTEEGMRRYFEACRSTGDRRA